MNFLSFHTSNRARFFLTFLVVLLRVLPALAETSVNMRDSTSGEMVSCTISAQNEGAVGSRWNSVMEWCIKACEVHGYGQISGFGVVQVGDWTLNPTLSIADWPLAERITPRQCLPYEPVPMKPKRIGVACLRYGVRTEISGLLAVYGGWNWMIESPTPNCVVEGSVGRLRRPGLHNLTDITLRLPAHDYSTFKKLVGRQITVSGKLQYVVKYDTAELKLRDVRFVRINKEKH
jgi:hypothetical protein